MRIWQSKSDQEFTVIIYTFICIFSYVYTHVFKVYICIHTHKYTRKKIEQKCVQIQVSGKYYLNHFSTRTNLLQEN